MQPSELLIGQGADVVGPDGPLGTVSHVIIDEPTREISELVVRRSDGQEWLIPAGAVTHSSSSTLTLSSRWSDMAAAARPYRADEFEHIASTDTARASVAVSETAAPLRPSARAVPGGGSLQLREEELLVRKQPRELGAVELRKEIVAERQMVQIPVWHEELLLQRERLDPPQPTTTKIAEQSSFRVVLREEVAIVDKQPVVTEVVRAGKRIIHETQDVEETVHREVARVQKEGDVILRGQEQST